MQSTIIKLLSLSAVILFCATTNLSAKQNSNTIITDSIVTKPDILPEFPGGRDSLSIYFTNNLRYPWKAARKHIEGRVICQFTVDTIGKIQDVKVVKSVNKHLDKEAVRVIASMPLWRPAWHNGKKVFTKFTLPVGFFIYYE